MNPDGPPSAPVDTAEHLDALRREGALLASAAARAGLDTAVPTCPEWRVRDLVRHVGDVHRWAAAHVAGGRLKPIGRRELPAVAGPLPLDRDLIRWFADGHAALVRTLETAPPDVACWAFLPAPSPLAFWARRQAHETGIHRADAESPTGTFTAFGPAMAVDGIDELLFGFLAAPAPGPGPGSGPGTQPGPTPEPTLALHAVDTDDRWLVRFGPDRVLVERIGGDAACSVRATASDVLLLLWNRRPAEGLEVTGDPSVLGRWRQEVRITWSRPR